ncbi:hypothetical protein SAMN06265337_2079 [Hymenobacter gelipurpurascens]|uniref:Thioredoxin n=1 Tax=Hymenobacter gelipurpurascens TaxID=89968 RepID=A0A212TP49_9BACT|nr:hypothetical protein [Hymenobacter gelipurpurascens]SNC67808.1 hypothetical protein SAMN06265337_2079 [Hymenobacter gelipurpurascens]
MLPSTAQVLPVTAVLLVMLPPLAGDMGAQSPAYSPADLAALQRRLGPAVRVLKVDEANYSAVVRSFTPTQLPTCVLVHQGVELWRQQGLFQADEVVASVLAKVAEFAT